MKIKSFFLQFSAIMATFVEMSTRDEYDHDEKIDITRVLSMVGDIFDTDGEGFRQKRGHLDTAHLSMSTPLVEQDSEILAKDFNYGINRFARPYIANTESDFDFDSFIRVVDYGRDEAESWEKPNWDGYNVDTESRRANDRDRYWYEYEELQRRGDKEVVLAPAVTKFGSAFLGSASEELRIDKNKEVLAAMTQRGSERPRYFIGGRTRPF